MATMVYANLKLQQGPGLQQPSLQQAAYAQCLPSCPVTPATMSASHAQMQAAAQDAIYAQPHFFGQAQASMVEPFQLAMPQFEQPSYGPPAAFAQHAIQAGLPDAKQRRKAKRITASIAKQALTYSKALEAEEARTMESLEQQRKQHMATIYEQAEQQRQQILLQIEHQVKHMEMNLAKDFAQQVGQTKQQYNDLRSALEQQAIQLTAEAQTKLVQDAAMQQQAKLRQKKAASELAFMGQMQRLQQPAHVIQTPSYVPPVVMAATSGSYVPPPCNMAHAYCPPVYSTSVQNGSYVPPPAFHNLSTPVVVGYSGSYVPPPAGLAGSALAGSYVPPPAVHMGGGGSYVPPPVVLVRSAVGSYVPPLTVFSGIPAATTVCHL